MPPVPRRRGLYTLRSGWVRVVCASSAGWGRHLLTIAMNGYILTACAAALIGFLFQKALSDRLNRSRRAREAEMAAAWNNVEAAFERVLRERQLGESVSHEALPVLKARILVFQGRLSQDDYRVFAQTAQIQELGGPWRHTDHERGRPGIYVASVEIHR